MMKKPFYLLLSIAKQLSSYANPLVIKNLCFIENYRNIL